MVASLRLTKIDDLTRGLHPYLQATDECYFLREFTSGQNYAFSDTNQLISNLKKKRGAGGFKYKAGAIRQCAIELSGSINHDRLRRATVVPVPPSKIPTHPEYDDRILRVCQALVASAGGGEVRELVRQTQSTEAFHTQAQRLRVDELAALYEIDEEAAEGMIPSDFAIVDDVLTNGTHFKAMQRVLNARFPGVPIVGFFLARRVFANDVFDDFG